MKNRKLSDEAWDCATYEGVELIQLRQTARMSLTERLKALDRMISLAKQLQPDAFAVRESDASYGKTSE